MTATATTSTGTVVTSGSTSYIASTASGLDTASLVAAAVATKTAAADTIDAEVTANKNKISAYTDAQTLVNNLSTAISALASPSNVSVDATSAFDATTASLAATSGDSSDANAVTVSTTSSAATGSYSLGVTQLAKAMKVSGATMDGSSALGLTGTFSLGVSGGGSASISVTSDMTLADVASAISAQSATTGVNAALIKVSDGSYQLVLSGAQTSQTLIASDVQGDSILNAIGLTGSDGSFSHVVQQPQDAVITLDGATITRSSNTLDDVVPGVSITLDSTTSSTDALNLDVAKDYSGVTSDFENFVSAYNSLRDFITSQNAVDDGGAVDSNAVLFADTVLRSLDSSLKGLLTNPSASADGSLSYLSQLGVTIDSDNDLVLDASTLDGALSSNPSAVENFFQTSTTTSDPSLKVTGANETQAMSFNLDVSVDASGAVAGATVNGQSGLFTVSGSQIVGAAGTAYAGLTFSYSGSASDSIAVSVNPGFADQIVSTAKAFGDTGSGSLQQQINVLTAQDTALSAQSTQIRSDASDYQTTLINKYAQMETQISAEKILQQEIAAILNGGSNNG